jgi:hypothetical protein
MPVRSVNVTLDTASPIKGKLLTRMAQPRTSPFPRDHIERRRLQYEITAVVLIILIGTVVRFWNLATPMMWCDEAESSINALTILDHGVPVNHYLGLPLYENILTRKWEGHPEYEFADTSYSSKGYVTYHGWLPLYCMAGSFWAAGIEPDRDDGTLISKHTVDEIDTRTIAARVPMVIAGSLFLVVIYFSARQMYGVDAAFAALLVATVSTPIIRIARQARYYALTVLLSTLCAWLIYRMWKTRQWKDFILGGAAFVLLFHTHVLTFATAGFMMALISCILVRDRTNWGKIAVFGLIVLAGTVPWMVWSGFLETVKGVPKAWTYLTWSDVFSWPLARWPMTLFILGGIAIPIVLSRWLPKRHAEHWSPGIAPAIFLGVWCIAGWALFMTLIPAASLFWQRVYLGTVGPGMILGAILFAALARMIGYRVSVPLASILFLGFVYANLRTSPWWLRQLEQRTYMRDLTAVMTHWNPREGTRVYATPNDHLTLQFFTGVPVQSVAPVRKEFLDSYPKDIVFFDCTLNLVPLVSDSIHEEARKDGLELTEEQAAEWAKILMLRGPADFVRPTVRYVTIPADPLPAFARRVLKEQVNRTHVHLREIDDFVAANPAVFRGYRMDTYADWWGIFYYRFVDPDSRRGTHANYADRLKTASAHVLQTSWIVYLSPGAQQPELSEHDFKRILGVR